MLHTNCEMSQLDLSAVCTRNKVTRCRTSHDSVSMTTGARVGLNSISLIAAAFDNWIASL